MAREEGRLLDSGDEFPAMELECADGERIVVPEAFRGRWTVLLFYRGHW